MSESDRQRIVGIFKTSLLIRLTLQNFNVFIDYADASKGLNYCLRNIKYGYYSAWRLKNMILSRAVVYVD